MTDTSNFIPMIYTNTKHNLIQSLNLQPHPEGGYYNETYRSQETYTLSRGIRSISTSIYFLLGIKDRSRFHVIKSDEIWHHYDGLPLEIHEITAEGLYKVTLLGKDLSDGQVPQYCVSKGHIFGSKIASSYNKEAGLKQKDEQYRYTLVGCTVTPGFDFEDFHLFSTLSLLEQYPQYQDQIHDFFNPYIDQEI
jgi:uncharacterized protein